MKLNLIITQYKDNRSVAAYLIHFMSGGFDLNFGKYYHKFGSERLCKQNQYIYSLSDCCANLLFFQPLSHQKNIVEKMSANPFGIPPNSYRVVLIDDEPSARKVLRSFIEEYCPKLQIVGEANGVEEGGRLILEVDPGLVFLDVEMGDGQGFDLLDKFPNPSFKVIFTTAHDQFAVKAFKYYAVDYLLKPIDPDELVVAVKKTWEQHSGTGLFQLLQAMQLPRLEQVFDKMALPSSDGITMMNVKDILRLESDAGYTTFHSRIGEKVMVTRSIGEFEDVLPDESFYRVHVSHLINIDFVKKFLREDGGYVLLENGDKIPIARRRKDGFLERLKGRSAF